MLEQSLQQKLQQRMSAYQIQAMKLVEIPAALLEQRIKDELESNPMLEIDPSGNEEDNKSDSTNEDETYDKSIEEYLSQDETPSYLLKANNYSPDDKHEDIPFSEGTSFYEHLEEQLGQFNFSEKEETIAKYIIGNIDEDGYLRRSVEELTDDISFATNLEIEDIEVDSILQTVQHFDPIGVGARDLRECLQLQLRARDLKNPTIKNAYDIITLCFDEFTRKHYDKIMKRLHIEDEDEIREAFDEIVHLNPKPGSAYSGAIVKTAQPIIPDFIVEYEDNQITFRLNARNEPELRISNTYKEMLRKYMREKNNRSKSDKEAMDFVKQKIESAKWFIEALKQRRNTLTLVMDSIIKYQGDYFIDGDESKLKPMILKDIADKTGLDPSTISRVSNSKYAQTPFGIVSLKSFFSEKIQNNDGDDVSSREVKKIIQDAINAEDKRKPLTDDKLTELLSGKSFNIARRTVAKYREQLGIPVARLRKEL